MFIGKYAKKQAASQFIRRMILSWLFGVTLQYLLLPVGLRSLRGLEGLKQMSLLGVIASALGGAVLLRTLSRHENTGKVERQAMVGIFIILASAALRASFTWAFLGVCAFLLALLVAFALLGWNSLPEPAKKPRQANKIWIWITLGLTIGFFLFVSAWTVGRVYSFRTPTFDFGIFSQMFYNMKKTGLPMTTVERDGQLSHFAVHVSPIYYLLLPFYALFPCPAALQVLQAAVIASAVIPLWKIGKHLGLPGPQRTLVCALLLLYPAFSGGTSYDIHENCFLTPLLLWLFYGIHRKNTALTAAAVVLTLAVKEDAAVYTAVIALWQIVKTLLRSRKPGKWELAAGIGILALSLGWFFLVTGYLAKRGDGVMTYRYNNFMYDGSSSLITVIKSVILNPMKAVYECVDTEKLWFIAITLFPLLCLPLLTRRYERYILLIPYILVNLMSDYPYQHDIFFQYAFGSTGFFLYLTAVNLADIKQDWKRLTVLTAAVIVSAVCFYRVVIPKAIFYPVQAVRYYDYYQGIRDVLSEIPEDASVAAGTFYTTQLSQRETLYDLRYGAADHILEAQYVVLDPSASGDYKPYAENGGEDGFDNLIHLLEGTGYAPYKSIGSTLLIYRKE